MKVGEMGIASSLIRNIENWTLNSTTELNQRVRKVNREIYSFGHRQEVEAMFWEHYEELSLGKWRLRERIVVGAEEGS